MLRRCHIRRWYQEARSCQRNYATGSWKDLGLHPALLQRLADVNFTQPTAIQAKSIPHVLQGRHAVCHAETGCGKTLCYLLPLFNRLLCEQDSRSVTQDSAQYAQQSVAPMSYAEQGGLSPKSQFLVFVPTPELGLQLMHMYEHLRPNELAKTPAHLWEGLREGRSYVDTTSPLIITTFSKLRDYDHNKLFGHIPTLVLDEADVYHTGRLKNLTYRILGEFIAPFRYHTATRQLPKPKQLVYVAATLNTYQRGGSGNNLQKWLQYHHVEPVFLRTTGTHVTPSALDTYWRYVEDEDFTWELIKQLTSFYCTEEYELTDSIPEAYKELDDPGIREQPLQIHIPEDMPPIQEEVLHPDRKVLIFLNSADAVNVLYRNIINYLRQSPCASVRELARRVYRLSGSLSREERAAVVKRIQRGSIRILIASDIASRGLDIPHLDMVINAQLPVDSVGYLHRAGRTARMGAHGTVLNFLSIYDAPLYRKIAEVSRREIPRFDDTMKADPRVTKVEERKEEVDGNRKPSSSSSDPWLNDNPASFVSKIYRNDFTI